MKPSHWLASWLAACLFIGSMAAQTGTGHWRGVRHIRPGDRISVAYRKQWGATYCHFLTATRAYLYCLYSKPSFAFALPPIPLPVYQNPARTIQLRFRRHRIRQVRLEHEKFTNGLIGAGIGLGIGVGLVAMGKGSGSKIGGTIIIGSFLGAIGAYLGSHIPLFHRRTIYRRSLHKTSVNVHTVKSKIGHKGK